MESSLVRFQQPPSPDSLWAEAGHDAPAFGAALDRLFGEAADVHLLEHFTVAGVAHTATTSTRRASAEPMEGMRGICPDSTSLRGRP